MRLLRFKEWYALKQMEYAAIRLESAQRISRDAREELLRAEAWEAAEAARLRRKQDAAKRAAFETRRAIRMIELGI